MPTPRYIILLLAIAVPAPVFVHGPRADDAATLQDRSAPPRVNLARAEPQVVSAGPGLAIERAITFERFTQFRDKDVKHSLVPRISADGKKIAFASAEGTYVLDVDTKAIRRLDKKPSAYIGLSADGRRIAWMGEGGLASELHLAHDDGSNHTNVKLDPDRGNVLRLTAKGDLAIVMTWYGTIHSYAVRGDKLEKVKDVLPKAQAVTALARGKPVDGYGIRAEMDASDNGEHIVFRAGQFLMKINGDGSGLSILKDFGDGFRIDKLAMSGSGEKVACFGRFKNDKTTLTFWTWNGARLPIAYGDLVQVPNAMQMTRDGKHVLYSGYAGRVMKFAVDQQEKLDATEQGVPMSEFAGYLSITADARLGTMQIDDMGHQIVLIDFNPATLRGAPRILDVRASARTLALKGDFTYVSARSDPKIREVRALLLRDHFFAVGSVVLSAPPKKAGKEPADRTYSGNLELRADPKLSPGPVTLRLIAQSEAKHTLVLDLKGIKVAAFVKIEDQQIATRLGFTVEEVRQLRSRLGMTTNMLMNFPLNKRDALRRKLANPKIQQARTAHTALMLKNGKGAIPPDAKAKAIRDAQAKMAPAPGQVAGLPVGPTVDPRRLYDTAGAGPRRWQALGPPKVGGRTRALLIHPNDPNILYAGSAGGGVWKSDDAGDSWRPISVPTANLAVSCLVMDPTNPDRIYAGTGEGINYFDATRAPTSGDGIYLTANGGNSWQAVPTPAKAAFKFVNRLAISKDGKILLAAVGRYDAPAEEGNGIYRLALDNPGATWEELPVLPGTCGCVLFHPDNAAECVASSMQKDQNNPIAIAWYSTEGGARGTWHPATTIEPFSPGVQPRVELAYARKQTQDRKTVYASADIANGTLWCSTDGGQTYSKRAGREVPHPRAAELPTASTASPEPVPYLGSQGFYDNAIWAGDPNDDELVVVGGIQLWKSHDGGNNLHQISQWNLEPDSAHADQHVIVAPVQFGPQNKTVFVGNDGGIYRANDVTTVGYLATDGPREQWVFNGKQGWAHKSFNYAVTEFWGAAGYANADGSFLILAGAQDNDVRLAKVDATWKADWAPDARMRRGDGCFCAIDQTDPTIAYAERITLQIFRIKNGARDGGDFNIGEQEGSNFYSPFILDPNNQQRLLAGGASLWVTDNAKEGSPQFQKIKNSAGHNHISAIAVAKEDTTKGNIIWVGHNEGQVYKTANGLKRDGVPDWGNPVLIRDRVTNREAPRRLVSRIVIHPSDPKKVYVTFAGYAQEPRNLADRLRWKKGSVWSTEDGGTTWTDLSETLVNAPVFTLAIHPTKAGYLYVGNEVGVFASEDGGKNWSPTNEGPCKIAVSELFWIGQTSVLGAATRGRGVYRSDLSGL